MPEKPFNYEIIEDFLNKEDCTNLIEQAQRKIPNLDLIKIQANRSFFPCTSHSYKSLLRESKLWKELDIRLNSPEFFDYLTKKLNLDDSYEITRLFSSETINENKIISKIKSLSEQTNLTRSETRLIMAQLCLRLLLNSLRIIKGIYTKLIKRNNLVELLYDYSISSNGYLNEIHRDSDSRIIVFLIYLNELNEEGGNLDLYTKNMNGEFELFDSIRPKPGRMVVFENSKDAFHGVLEMQNITNKRHFIYGSYTKLFGKIKNIDSAIKTEFNLYY